MIIKQTQIKLFIYMYMIISMFRESELIALIFTLMLSILCVFDMKYMEVPTIVIYIGCFLISGLQPTLLSGWLFYICLQLLNLIFAKDIIGQGDMDIFMMLVWAVGLYESCKIILMSCILAYIYSKIKHTHRFAFIPFIYMSYILWRL